MLIWSRPFVGGGAGGGCPLAAALCGRCSAAPPAARHRVGWGLVGLRGPGPLVTMGVKTCL